MARKVSFPVLIGKFAFHREECRVLITHEFSDAVSICEHLSRVDCIELTIKQGAKLIDMLVKLEKEENESVRNLTPFEEAYFACALWSSNDESTPAGGEPFDSNYNFEDIAPEAVAQMKKDCREFQKIYAKLMEGLAPDQCGHDFWLTRNGHGAGFWDRGYPKEIGDGLTKACKAFGECDLYLGDDKKIYIQ